MGDADATAQDLILTPNFRIAVTSNVGPASLCVIIDTEEEFNWAPPFSRDGYSLESISAQWRAQEIFDRWHVKPVYLITYPVLKSPDCEKVFRGFYESGRCEVGVQLHPWITPPFDEALNLASSFPCNLARGLHLQKLETIAAEFRARFGFDPKIHKAGRFGF